MIIISLGLVQMTVLARVFDNHQFGLLTVSLVIIALADTLSDFGIANSIIQRKEISHLELTTLYWLNVGLGIVVCVAVFLLSDVIGRVLHNPDLIPLIKALSLAFLVIPHGQQFRALMQKELEFNKIGMIETSAVLAGFTFTVISAHFWPWALTAIWDIWSIALCALCFSVTLAAKFTVPACIFRLLRFHRTCALARG